MKKLIIVVVGDDSLHDSWKSDCYDLFLVYYGDEKNKYQDQAKYYAKLKGTKFNIIHQLYLDYADIISEYEYVFIPDDDLFLYPGDIDRMFEITKEYNILLSQPSIIGYFSLPITLPTPSNLFRFTNYVEIMCPCFEINTFKELHHTFNYNKSCWGIDLMWNMCLGKPKDKIAIIDNVVAIHTRPVYKGDNYSNNQIHNPYQDILDICEKYDLNTEKTVHEYVFNTNMANCGKKQLVYPNNNKIRETCNRIRRIIPL